MPPSHRTSLALLGMLMLVSLGCCGPLACGPAGCSGPVSLAAPACGGCGDCQGCGEMYVDPWINDPPACDDPCDSCGNYNGQSCGSCRPVFSGIATLWGYRYDGGCGCGTAHTGCDNGPIGCDSCGPSSGCDCGGASAPGGYPMESGSMMYDQPYAEPLPAPEPIEAVESDSAMMESYVPSRNKQIFRRRGTSVQRPTPSRF